MVQFSSMEQSSATLRSQQNCEMTRSGPTHSVKGSSQVDSEEKGQPSKACTSMHFPVSTSRIWLFLHFFKHFFPNRSWPFLHFVKHFPRMFSWPFLHFLAAAKAVPDGAIIASPIIKDTTQTIFRMALVIRSPVVSPDA